VHIFPFIFWFRNSSQLLIQFGGGELTTQVAVCHVLRALAQLSSSSSSSSLRAAMAARLSSVLPRLTVALTDKDNGLRTAALSCLVSVSCGFMIVCVICL
jgi:hypothetical protein